MAFEKLRSKEFRSHFPYNLLPNPLQQLDLAFPDDTESTPIGGNRIASDKKPEDEIVNLTVSSSNDEDYIPSGSSTEVGSDEAVVEIQASAVSSHRGGRRSRTSTGGSGGEPSPNPDHVQKQTLAKAKPATKRKSKPADALPAPAPETKVGASASKPPFTVPKKSTGQVDPKSNKRGGSPAEQGSSNKKSKAVLSAPKLPVLSAPKLPVLSAPAPATATAAAASPTPVAESDVHRARYELLEAQAKRQQLLLEQLVKNQEQTIADNRATLQRMMEDSREHLRARSRERSRSGSRQRRSRSTTSGPNRVDDEQMSPAAVPILATSDRGQPGAAPMEDVQAPPTSSNHRSNAIATPHRQPQPQPQHQQCRAGASPPRQHSLENPHPSFQQLPPHQQHQQYSRVNPHPSFQQQHTSQSPYHQPPPQSYQHGPHHFASGLHGGAQPALLPAHLPSINPAWNAARRDQLLDSSLLNLNIALATVNGVRQGLSAATNVTHQEHLDMTMSQMTYRGQLY